MDELKLLIMFLIYVIILYSWIPKHWNKKR